MRRAFVSAVLLLLAGSARAEERPLAVRIREANSKATKAIAKKWSTVARTESTYDGHARTLVALTLLRAGGPEERAIAKRMLDDWWLDAVAGKFGDPQAPALYGTYVVALGVSALEALTLEPLADDEVSTLTRYEKKAMPGDLAKRLELATTALERSAVTMGKECAFGYRCSPFAATRDAVGNGAWDNSNTQFVALALHDAARGGVKVPAETIDGLVEHFAGEWVYTAEAPPRPSMTLAALSTLAIARSLGSRDERIAGLVSKGLDETAKMLRTLGPATTGEHGFGAAYRLYSLEKALDLLEVETVDGKDWFAPLAERVLKAQESRGLWGESDLIDSCFYVLFLVRASFGASRLGPRTVARGGAEADALGTLKVFADAPSPRARASVDESLAKLVVANDGREAVVVPALADLTRKPPLREAASRWLEDLCGKTPSGAELDAASERLEKLRGSPSAAEVRAALAKATLLPVRAYAASRAPSAELVLDAADQLYSESILETKAGARCAHAFAAALRKLVKGELPALSADVKPAELRWLVHVARERLAGERSRK